MIHTEIPAGHALLPSGSVGPLTSTDKRSQHMAKTATVTLTVNVDGESKTFTASAETDGEINLVATGLANALRWDAAEWLSERPSTAPAEAPSSPIGTQTQ
jgi:hypothetical protein